MKKHLIEYKNLMNVKLSLEKEIDVYRSLLEGQSSITIFLASGFVQAKKEEFQQWDQLIRQPMKHQILKLKNVKKLIEEKHKKSNICLIMRPVRFSSSLYCRCVNKKLSDEKTDNQNEARIPLSEPIKFSERIATPIAAV